MYKQYTYIHFIHTIHQSLLFWGTKSITHKHTYSWKEGQEALSADINKIKSTLSEIATVNNFRVDQVDNTNGHEIVLINFMQTLM